MGTEPHSTDNCDDAWEIALYCAKEARLLRSFLDYLLISQDAPEFKTAKLKEWRKHVGLQFGRPEFHDEMGEAFQRVRDSTLEERSAKVQQMLSNGQQQYFQGDS